MVFFNQISFKYYENLGIYYILNYLDICQKELKSIQPLVLNTGAWLHFVARSMFSSMTCRLMLIYKFYKKNKLLLQHSF